MNKYILLCAALLFFQKLTGQNIFRTVIKDSLTNETLSGASASIKGMQKMAIADGKGEITLENIPGGNITVVFSHTGYIALALELDFPLRKAIPVIYLSAKLHEATGEVFVMGTRSNRSIAKIPTRVEVLTEEIDEAATMDPSKIAHLLTHSTGIQVQQTSATSNTANVRIQGLDGRYTQMLKDGFPLYGGFSGSLSIMQIPPLDLRQIEYIKGSASTLYGGGAISGLINLISKEPSSEETILHLNGSHIGAFDINMFTSRKREKIGYTLLAQRNAHRAFDADKDGFTDLPQLVKYNFNPKLVFYVNPKLEMSFAGTFTTESRQGGDTKLLNGEAVTPDHFYKEKNDISRITTQTKLEYRLASNHVFMFRNSFSIFKRELAITPSFAEGEYKFAGNQLSSFSEISYSIKKEKNVLITGVNIYSDAFKEIQLAGSGLRNENRETIGFFANYTFDIGKKISIEAGIRGDNVLKDRMYLLPRASALFKWTKRLTTRIGGGLGYRNASIFNQEAELLGYKNVLAIDRNTTKAERSYGGSADIGYKFLLGEKMFINVNQMFFYTYLDNPLALNQSGADYRFQNVQGYSQSKGGETFFKFGFYDFVLFAGYTYTDATNHFNGVRSPVPLTPKHSLKGDLLYALPGEWRIGVDYEFKSSQTLSNGRKTKSFWTYGAVVERYYKIFTFFGNVENVFDYRQTRKERLLTAPNNTPQITEVWAPLDGFVFNFGLKIKF